MLITRYSLYVLSLLVNNGLFTVRSPSRACAFLPFVLVPSSAVPRLRFCGLYDPCNFYSWQRTIFPLPPTRFCFLQFMGNYIFIGKQR